MATFSIDGIPHRLELGAGRPRRARFATGLEKAQWLDAEASLDSYAPWLRRLAQSIIAGARSRGEQANRLHRWVRDRIAYVRDPGGREEFADPATVAATGLDDCDGKARMLVALVRSLRDPDLRARIRPVFAAGWFSHVQAELTWAGAPHAPAWELAELIVRGVPLSGNPEDARDAAGRYTMAGPRAPRPVLETRGIGPAILWALLPP